ncbi:MAG: HEAT repeat domain-containing protein, partial [Candidatus Desulforudaceae bacterium]
MQIKSLHDYARDLRLGSVALRYHAVRQLVYYRGQGDLCGAILPAADDPDPILRREACLALGGFGREALAILLKALNDPDSQVAAAAARGLGQTGQTDAVPALFQALQSSGTDIRAAVGQALGAFPGAGAEKQLLDRLQAPGSIGEVIGMCSGLVELRSSEVVMPLTAVYMFATDQWVRDETWRFLTTLLGVEADTDELHEEVILEVIRQCLECVPHQLSDIDLTDIRKTVQERDIAGYCRL